MSLLGYLHYFPQVGKKVFVAEGAKIIGRVLLGDEVNVWFNAVLRGDVHSIEIGEKTNIQDLCMLHVTEDHGLKIGAQTSLGHSVILHGCQIGEGCLIGMGAIILDGAEVGDYSLVAAGSMITPGKKFPPRSLIKGRPAVVERELTQEEVEKISHHYLSYLQYKDQYLG